jgi:hypothetical protein
MAGCLDGAGPGRPGSNYVREFGSEVLVGQSPPAGPRAHAATPKAHAATPKAHAAASKSHAAASKPHAAAHAAHGDRATGPASAPNSHPPGVRKTGSRKAR